MYEEKEVLTSGERFINLVYYIFRYSLYAIAWGFLSYISNKLIPCLLLGIFIYCTLAKQANDEKVLQSLMAEERHKVHELYNNLEKNNTKEEKNINEENNI